MELSNKVTHQFKLLLVLMGRQPASHDYFGELVEGGLYQRYTGFDKLNLTNFRFKHYPK